jgi:hypothetical protein
MLCENLGCSCDIGLVQDDRPFCDERCMLDATKENTCHCGHPGCALVDASVPPPAGERRRLTRRRSC